ncbi:120.7 kDa protein in NOF-FB transposable element [Frankliniella fusca]|uniref:120.7 kDa protein in NOF-FB transposable element n=1 Tax=Frankliniella fusca TaxID=407009 RepID=A0AAE1LGR7_9NEOP|nr:120.7 kDa protein in NOF-FB transposable element [Frankliniella fusca]
MVGRQPKIPHDSFQEIILKYEVTSEKGVIFGPCHEVWLEISKAVDSVFTPNYCYVYVKDNRHGIYDRFLKDRNIERPAESSSEDFGSKESDSSNPDDDFQEKKTEIKPMMTFSLLIPPEQWNQMKPVTTECQRKERPSGKRSRLTLPPYTWEPIIMELLWSNHKIPCPYSFSHGTVYTSETRDCYIKIDAACKECGASATATILVEPQGEEHVPLKWHANDSRGVPHKKKRPLSYSLREKVGGILQGQSASAFRKNEAFSLMEHAQMHIFRTMCKENYTVLAIDASGSLVLRPSMPSGSTPHIFLYEGVISAGTEQLPIMQMLSARQDAGIIKFWIDEFLRQGAPIPHETVTDHSKAIINAVVVTFGGSSSLKDYFERCFFILTSTDSIVDPEVVLPKTYLRLDPAHLFGGAAKWPEWKNKLTKRLKPFYLQCLGLLVLETTLEGFKDTFSKVARVASHQFTNDLVTQELNDLIKRIEGIPTEITEIMQAAETYDSADEDLIECFDEEDPTPMGEDLSNYVKNIRKAIYHTAAEEDGPPNPYYVPDVMKRFLLLLPDFLLWTAILVDTFRSATLTGSSARVESDFGNLKRNILGNTHPLRLDKFLAKHLVAVEGTCHIVQAEKTCQRKNCTENSGGADSPNTSENIQSNEDSPSENGGEDDIRNDQKKNNIMNSRDDVDKDLTEKTIQNIKKNKVQKRKRINSTDEEEEDITDHQRSLSETEDWRGKGKATPYLNTNPELSLVLNSNSLQAPRDRLLVNGLKKGFINTSGNTKVQVKNTCAFDVLTQIITNGYIQYGVYRSNIESHLSDDGDHDLLSTCKSLAVNGAVHKTYLLRVVALSKITQPAHVVGSAKSTTRSRKSTVNITYDCFSDLVDVSRQLLRDLMSATLKFKCSLRSFRRCTPDDEIQVVNADVGVILDQGIRSLGTAILVSLKMMTAADPLPEGNTREVACPLPCTGMASITCEFGPHLIVNVDQFGSCESGDVSPAVTKVKIQEFPTKLCLLGTEFILCGIAARQPGHYVAYGRRAGGQWEVYNDLVKSVKRVKDTHLIQPVLAMYVRLL